jgi:hypothetical protein
MARSTQGILLITNSFVSFSAKRQARSNVLFVSFILPHYYYYFNSTCSKMQTKTTKGGPFKSTKPFQGKGGSTGPAKPFQGKGGSARPFQGKGGSARPFQGNGGSARPAKPFQNKGKFTKPAQGSNQGNKFPANSKNSFMPKRKREGDEVNDDGKKRIKDLLSTCNSLLDKALKGFSCTHFPVSDL